MSLPRRFLAIVLLSVPIIGCEVEDDEKQPPAAPAPTEPAEPTRPVPQPQVGPGGQADRVYAAARAGGPAFALRIG